MKARIEPTTALVAALLFLCPLIGGQVAHDQWPAENLLLSIFTGGAESALLTHAFLAFLALAALGIALSRRIIQTPHVTVTVAWIAFFALLSASVVASSFRLASIAAAGAWLTYGIGFFATVASVGRTRGPGVLLGAVHSGCVVLALRGILEYGESADPTWRIFGGWVNPNATAAMLLVGLFTGLALALTAEGRLRLLAALGTVLVAFALVLTQSKGALLVAVLVGVVAAPLLVMAAEASERKRAIGTVVAIALVAGVLTVGLQAASRSRVASAAAPGGGALSRVASADSTGEQSAGFRQLLWRGAADMIREVPIGTGIGTYRYESGRSGRHTQTMYAHQAYLQLATEGSLLLPALFLFAVAVWLRRSLRGWKALPSPRKQRLIGALAAVTAIGAHSMVDSDLYYFGIGMVSFCLMGIVLTQATDGVAPEYMPPLLRRQIVGIAVVAWLLLGYGGMAEAMRSTVRAALASRDAEASAAAASSAIGFSPIDGDAWALVAQAAPDQPGRRAAMERAAELAPSTRNLRMLATLQFADGKQTQAISTLRRALRRDPNNLRTLLQLADQLRDFGDTAGEAQTLKRLVAVEGTTYFRVRSLPELVPTETFIARYRLAQTLRGLAKIAMLKASVDGFREYAAKTVPPVKRMEAALPGLGFAGETMRDVEEKLGLARKAAAELAAAYRATGESALAAEAAGAFEGVK